MKGNVFILVAASLLTFGCTPAKIPTRIEVADITYIHPQPPAPLVLRDLEWRVMNYERLEEYVRENEGRDVALFVLETKDYEALALNMQEIIRYIREQQAIINYYRRILPQPEGITSER